MATPLEKKNGYVVLDYLMTRTYERTNSTKSVGSQDYKCYIDCIESACSCGQNSSEFADYVTQLPIMCQNGGEDAQDQEACECLYDCTSRDNTCVDDPAEVARNEADARAASNAVNARHNSNQAALAHAIKGITDAEAELNKKISQVQNNYGPTGRDTLIAERMYKIGKNDLLPSVTWWVDLTTVPLEYAFNALWQNLALKVDPTHMVEDGPWKTQAHQDVNDFIVKTFSSLGTYIGSAVNNSIGTYNGISDSMRNMGIGVMKSFGAQMDTAVNPGYDTSSPSTGSDIPGSGNCCTYKCNVSPGSKNRPSYQLKEKLEEFAKNKYKLDNNMDPISRLIEGDPDNLNVLLDIESPDSTDSDPLFLPGDDFAGLTATQAETAAFLGGIGFGGAKVIYDPNFPAKCVDSVKYNFSKDSSGAINGVEYCTLNGKRFPDPATNSARNIADFNAAVYEKSMTKQFAEFSTGGSPRHPEYFNNKSPFYHRFMDGELGGKIIPATATTDRMVLHTDFDNVTDKLVIADADKPGKFKEYNNQTIARMEARINEIRKNKYLDAIKGLGQFIEDNNQGTVKTFEKWLSEFSDTIDMDGKVTRTDFDALDLDKIKEAIQKKHPERVVGLIPRSYTPKELGAPCFNPNTDGTCPPQYGGRNLTVKPELRNCPVVLPTLENETVFLLPNDLQESLDELGNVRKPAIIAGDPGMALHGADLTDNAGNMTLEEAKCTIKQRWTDFKAAVRLAYQQGRITEITMKAALTSGKLVAETAYQGLKALTAGALVAFMMACDEVEADCVRDLGVVRRLELTLDQRVKDYYDLVNSLAKPDTVRQEYGDCAVYPEGFCLHFKCDFKGCNVPSSSDVSTSGSECFSPQEYKPIPKYDFGCTAFWAKWQSHIPVTQENAKYFGYPIVSNPSIGSLQQTKNWYDWFNTSWLTDNP